MTQSIMKAIGNCLADIRHYRPQYPAQNDLSKHDRWIQFKFWLKNYARMGSLLIKVGPTRLIASLRAYPWLYDLLKANAMYQRAVFGRSGNYREAVAVAFDVIVAGTVEFLSWTINEPERLVLLEDMLPPEIARAMGLNSFMPEIVALLGTMIDSRSGERYIDTAENSGIATDSCTMPKVTMGIALRNHLPKGVAIVSSNLPCDAGATSYTLIAQKAGNVPIYRLDAPHYFKNEQAIALFVEDLKQMIAWLEAHTPGRMDWDRLKSICEERNRASELELEVWEMNRRKPSAMPGEPIWLYHLFAANLLPGTAAATAGWRKIHRLAKENYARQRPAFADERYRAVVWNPVPPMFSDINVWCEQTWGLTFVIDGTSYNTNPLIDTSSPETMLRDLAISIMNGPMARHNRGPAENFFDEMFDLVDNYAADILMMAGHVGCKDRQALTGILLERCRAKGVQLLIFDYDMMDPRIVSQEGIKTQINQFMEDVMHAERLNSAL